MLVLLKVSVEVLEVLAVKLMGRGPRALPQELTEMTSPDLVISFYFGGIKFIQIFQTSNGLRLTINLT